MCGSACRVSSIQVQESLKSRSIAKATYDTLCIPFWTMYLTTPRSTASSSVSPQNLPYSNAPNMLAQTIPFFSLAAIVVTGRCYVRALMLRAFGKDDWAIVLAMVSASPQRIFPTNIQIYQILSTVCFACYMIEISCGAGKYVAVIRSTPEKLSEFSNGTRNTHDYRQDWHFSGQDLSLVALIAARG